MPWGVGEGAANRQHGRKAKRDFGHGRSEGRSADKVLAGLLDDLLAKKVPAPLQLEVLEAAAKRKDKTVAAKLAKFEASRPTRRRISSRWNRIWKRWKAAMWPREEILFRKRGHQLRALPSGGQSGGEVGPRLDGIGAKLDRKHLLESIVNPGARSLKIYFYVLKNGKAVAYHALRKPKRTSP